MSKLPVINTNFSVSTLEKVKNQSASSSAEVDHLYEIEYIPGDQNPRSTLPLVNPYWYFTVKDGSQIVLSSSNRRVKEYVSSSKFSSCQVAATEKAQFFSLDVPVALRRLWQRKGFTHLHFGAVRLGLTLHARKGLDVTTTIALLDSRFGTYQEACIGTFKTTVMAGTVFVTFFPNINLSLGDPNLLNTLKVQLQIVGGHTKEESSSIATLHQQIVYRLQDHTLYRAFPSSNDGLYLELKSASDNPIPVSIPRLVSRVTLIKMLPEYWITSYEKLQPVLMECGNFHSNLDGMLFTVGRPSLTHLMIQIEETAYLGPYEVQFPIPYSFNEDGLALMPLVDENGHQFVDVCFCSGCENERYESDENSGRGRRRKKKDPLYQRFVDGDPTVGPLGECSGKYEFIVRYK